MTKGNENEHSLNRGYQYEKAVLEISHEVYMKELLSHILRIYPDIKNYLINIPLCDELEEIS